MTSESRDHIDAIQAQWAREAPEVDISGAAILGRARRITLAARPAIEACFKRHGLDTGEFDVLGTLRRAGAPFTLRPTELYRSLMISSGGLTDRLQRLEQRGLVRRIVSGEDARSLLVQLTEAGRAAFEAAFEEDMRIEREMVAGLTPQDRAELVRLLRKLALTFEG